jgi:PAS domain S-box-containing protein
MLNLLNLEWIWEPRNRTAVVLTSMGIVLAIAVVDWWTKPRVSLGFLYLLPILLAAGFVPQWAITLMGIACALLSERFSNLNPADAPIRTSFEALALVSSGLFISELLRNCRLRLTSQEQLRVLVETSPAAIVTVDEHGFIELANRAAAELMAPRDGNLIGQPIAAFLPELHHALRWEKGPQFRTSMQCLGHRGNGESLLADVWFSSYKEGPTPKVAAIIADVTEERSATADSTPAESNHRERTPLNNRESCVLRLLVQGLANRKIASRLRHLRECGQEHAPPHVRENRSAEPKPTRSRRIGALQGSLVTASCREQAICQLTWRCQTLMGTRAVLSARRGKRPGLSLLGPRHY